MKNSNGYWIDENNNQWNENIYSKDEAIKWSKTLNNCTDCTYCTDCTGCTDCTDCKVCRNCRN